MQRKDPLTTLRKGGRSEWLCAVITRSERMACPPTRMFSMVAHQQMIFGGDCGENRPCTRSTLIFKGVSYRLGNKERTGKRLYDFIETGRGKKREPLKRGLNDQRNERVESCLRSCGFPAAEALQRAERRVTPTNRHRDCWGLRMTQAMAGPEKKDWDIVVLCFIVTVHSVGHFLGLPEISPRGNGQPRLSRANEQRRSKRLAANVVSAFPEMIR